MVIFTSSSKLASLSLKSVAFDASTVKIFLFPAILEKVSPFERRVTSCGAAAALFAALYKRPISARDTHRPSHLPAATLPPPTSAHTSPLHFASCLQLSKIWKECIEERMFVQKEAGITRRIQRSRRSLARSRDSPRQRRRDWYSSPGTWPHRRDAAILPWFANPGGRRPRPRWPSAGCSPLPAPARCPRASICASAAPRSTRSLSKSAAAG